MDRNFDIKKYFLDKSKIAKYKNVFEGVDLSEIHGNWKSPLLSVDNEYLVTYRELKLANEKLQEKKKEKQLNDKELEKKWLDLSERQENFKQVMIENDAFFQENEGKCVRIKKRTEEELKIQKKYDEKIKSLQNQLNALSIEEDKLCSSIDTLQPYQEILQRLVDEGDTFKSIEELINNYEVLSSTGEELTLDLQNNIRDIETLYLEMMTFIQVHLKKLAELREKSTNGETKCKNIANSLTEWKNILEQLNYITDNKTCELNEHILQEKEKTMRQ